MPEYVTVEDLAEESIGASDQTEAQLRRIIQRASAQIDSWTKQFFVPRRMVMRLDGNGAACLQLGQPIIALERVRILAPEGFTLINSTEDIDPRNIRVYNRHITQSLFDPDDRLNPKIEFVGSWEGNRRLWQLFSTGWFPPGSQNIEITGWFGWTDPDPDEVVSYPDFPKGKTPEMIKLATLMLAARDTLALGDLQGRIDQALRARVTQLRTRDQQISYASTNSATGSTSGSISTGSGISGNTEVMAILAPYCKGPTLGAV